MLCFCGNNEVITIKFTTPWLLVSDLPEILMWTSPALSERTHFLYRLGSSKISCHLQYIMCYISIIRIWPKPKHLVRVDRSRYFILGTIHFKRVIYLTKLSLFCFQTNKFSATVAGLRRSLTVTAQK